MSNFIISTDSCVDHYKSYLEKNSVYSITLKRVLNGKEICEHFNTQKEYAAFYDAIKKGAMPTTSALNPIELQEYFEKILDKEKSGDIIHVSLSSGLSATYNNAVKAAAEVNKKLKNRQVHIIDSLVATVGMDSLVDELIKLRGAGKSTKEAIKRTEYLRDRQQGWVIMSDLMHLKRGGRISGVKATIGTILNIKPIIVITRKGKLTIQNKMQGNKNAIKYLISKIPEFGEKANPEFKDTTMYLSRSSESPLYEDFKKAIQQAYPYLRIQESNVSPIIGTHLGCGAVIMLFEGAKRLDLETKP